MFKKSRVIPTYLMGTRPTADLRRPRRLVPTLECLEGRVVPATFNVTTTADLLGGPALSLRQAVLNANTTRGPNTINLTVPGTYRLTRFGNAHDGTNGALKITNPDLTVNGLGPAVTVIDGGGVDRVFDIEGATIVVEIAPGAAVNTVTFNGVTIQHGLASSDSNKGSDPNGGSTDGGGIYSPRVNLALINTVVANNLAGDFGGGIWTDTGSVTINGGAVSNNSAGSAGGGLSTNSGAIAVTGATFADNLAASNGGGIAIASPTGTGNLTLAGCTFVRNTADFGGGAVIDLSKVNEVSITGTGITDNTADDSGGGLYVAAAKLTIDRSTITDNTADGSGGGIYANDNPNQVLRVTSSTLAGNTASADGGGIDSNAAQATFTSDSVSNNVASAGGGIAFSGTQVTLAGSHVEGNRAQRSEGGLFMSNQTVGSSCAITNSTLDNNRATGGPGGAFVHCTTLTVSNSSVNGNRAGGTAGGLAAVVTAASFINVNVIGNVAGGADGGLDLVDTTLTMTGCIISNNRSASSAGGLDAGGTATVSNTTISGNRTGGNDGGLLFSGTELNLLNDTITNNTAAANDGGVFVSATNGGTISNSTISGNRAAGHAGGIEADVTGGTLTITGCALSDSHAGRDGGGILVDGLGTVTMINDTVFGNTAAVNGGGIAHEFNRGPLNLVNVTIDGNAAANGGGVYSNQSATNVHNTIVAGNAANAAHGPDLDGAFNPQGFNFIGVGDDTTHSFTDGMDNDQVGSAAAPKMARLGPLQNNGGPTFTQALLPGSPAIDNAGDAGAPTTDQRGFSRAGAASIGAYEPQYAATASASQVFVEHLYEALLNRRTDSVGDSFVNELNAGVSRATVVQQIEALPEYRAAQVQQLYQRYLHRDADAGGLRAFTSFLGDGGRVEQVGAALVGSQEYFDLHDDNSEAFLNALYQDALGRQVDLGGLHVFGQALAGGMSRGQVAALTLSSAEYQGDLVQADFQSALGRRASPAEAAFFVGELQRGGSDQLVLAQVLGSAEAFARRG
jgi:hypothetical protein